MAQDASQLLANLESLDSIDALAASDGRRRRTTKPGETGKEGIGAAGVGEALGTAIATGFILGPVGGLLLGASQGILARGMARSELEAAAAEQELREEADAQINTLFEEQMRVAAMSPDDLQQLKTLQAQYGMASRMMSSPYAETADAGAALMQDVLAEHRAFSVRNEEQRIAQQVAEEKAIRDMGEQAWSRFNTVADDLHRESVGYTEQLTGFRSFLAASQNETGASDVAALTAAFKIFDPGSIVREGEMATIQNAGSVPEVLRNWYNEALTGKKLTAQQRAELKQVVFETYREAAEGQLERNTRYIQRAREGGVPEKYLNTMSIPILPIPQASAAPAAADSDVSESTVGDHALAAGATAARAGSAILDVPGVPEALGVGGVMSAKYWAPKLAALAAKIGLPAAAVVAAFNETGPQREGESNIDYEQRIERAARSATGGGAFDPTGQSYNRRPTN